MFLDINNKFLSKFVISSRMYSYHCFIHCWFLTLFANCPSSISGSISLILHTTSALRTLEDLARGLATVLVRISSLLNFFVCRQERMIGNAHSYAEAEQGNPQTVRDGDISACLQRLEKLESLCNHMMSKPPDMPKDKELLLLQSFDRIKSLEADLERTKVVSCFPY